MTFDQRLEQIRAARCMTVEEAAEASGASVKQWRKLEGGIHKPNIVTLENITRGLSLTPDQLFYLVTGARPRLGVRR